MKNQKSNPRHRLLALGDGAKSHLQSLRATRLALMTTVAAVALSGAAQAVLYSYEGFDYADTTLANGADNNTHLGTVNNDWKWGWGVWDVQASGMSYGSMTVSGASVFHQVDAGGSTIGPSSPNPARNRPSMANAAMGGAISTAGGFADGTTLWASILIDPNDPITNNLLYFAVGTEQVDHNGRLVAIGTTTQTAGDAIGIEMANTSLNTLSFQNNINHTNASTGFSAAGLRLYVLEMIWGATDTINIYTPGTDLVQGSAIATFTATVNNAAFDTVSLSGIDGNYFVDEIRFGDSYAAVVPSAIPEPSTALLGALGLLALLRRRR